MFDACFLLGKRLIHVSRQVNGKKAGTVATTPKIADRSREGDIFPATSIEEYVEQTEQSDDEDDNDDFICK